MVAVLIVGCAVLASCDYVFRLDSVSSANDGAVATIDANGDCSLDPFDVLGPEWQSFDDAPSATVAVAGTVTITLIRAVDTWGFVIRVAWGMTGHATEIEVVEMPASSSANTYMDWGSNGDWYSIYVEDGQLNFGYERNGLRDTKTVSYNPTYHRFWRIAHDPTADLVRFATRASDGDWNELDAVPVAIPLNAIEVELGSGTYRVTETSGQAQFDNFVFCPP